MPWRNRLTPWWAVGLAAVCLIVVAVDTGDLPGFPAWLWTHVYAAVAVMLVGWRASKGQQRHLLVGACGTMFVASFARASTWAVFEWPDRAAGVAINVLLAMLAVDFVMAQWRPAT